MPTPRRSPKKTMRQWLEEKRHERLLRESKGKLAKANLNVERIRLKKALEGPGTRKLRVSIGEDESYSGIDEYKPSPWRKTREELGLPKRVIGGKHHLVRRGTRYEKKKPLTMKEIKERQARSRIRRRK